MDLSGIESLKSAVHREVDKTVIGLDETIDLLLVSLLSGGHLLLEGVPGTAKTLIARTFTACFSLEFGRIQFTPDLMPGDVIGTNLFNFQTNQFTLTKGPLFSQLLLADEINRTPPKTQAALLEAMQERAVTIDGTTYELGSVFMVVATQNPIEQQGTYPLPEAQLDRFLFKHILEYPSAEEERRIVALHGAEASMPDAGGFDVTPVGDARTVDAVKEVVDRIRLNDDIVAYVVDIVRATREHPSLQFGASPRAASALASASRAYAALRGRDFVIPDDVKELAVPVLRHRLILAPTAEIEGLRSDDVIRQLLDQVAAPR